MQRVDCPGCGKRLKYDGGQAGKPAKCPGCQTALTLPGRPAVPPAEPQSPAPAPSPPPSPARPWPVTAPTPPLVVHWAQVMAPPPAVGEPFDLDDPPPGRDSPTGDDYDDRAARRPRQRWHAAFGLGCGLVKWGMWVNFAGSAYLTLLVEVSLLGVATKSRNLVVLDAIGLYAPLFLLQLAGTGMMLVGWWRMTAAPPNSGAGGLLTGAAALAGLREMVLLVGTVFFLLAAAARGLDTLKYLANASTALMIGNVCVWVATFSAIPGVAIVGGELPSRRLRQKAGQITFVHQILVIAVLALVAVAYFTVSAAELVPAGHGDRGGDPIPVPRVGRGDRPSREAETNPMALLMFFVMVLLLIEAAYTYLHYSLYSVGQLAAARGGDTR